MTSKLNFRFLLIFVFLISVSSIFGQNKAPKTVEASDGTFEKYVLVRWSPPIESKAFRVFRSHESEPEKTSEISNSRQKSTWFYDYGVTPGERYNYSIVAVYDGDENSNPSILDQGYPKPPPPIAGQNNDLETSLLAEVSPEAFERNSILNPMVENVRSGAFPFEISEPLSDAVFAPAVDLNIEIEGTLNTVNVPDNEPFILQVFQNGDQFEEEEILAQTDLKLQADEDKFTFSETIPFPYPQGRYYFVIVLESDGEPLLVGQFQVRK